MEEMSYVFPFTFFSLPLIFTLHWWPLASLIWLPLHNFHVVLPTKKCLLCFLSLVLDLCRPFSRWASLACSPLSLFLSFSCSIFQICGHDNLSKLNSSDNTDKETISAFRFRLYWLFCCLCFTRRRWLGMWFPAKITSSCIWVTIPVDWVILHWYTCGADGRSLGQAVYGHVITNFSQMGSLLYFLTHGALLARFAHEKKMSSNCVACTVTCDQWPAM